MMYPSLVSGVELLRSNYIRSVQDNLKPCVDDLTKTNEIYGNRDKWILDGVCMYVEPSVLQRFGAQAAQAPVLSSRANTKGQ